MQTRRHAPFALYAVIAVGWIVAGPAHGQDTHYWTEQYGARSMLLSGAVIGSVDDMSAVFYNPGALGYLKKPELVLSASAYQLRKLNVKDAGGRGVDLGSSKINLIPNLIAGTFRFNFHGANKLAYSVMTRYRFDAEIQTSLVEEVDLDPDIPGDETVAGGLLSSIGVSEVWVGLTWARGLGQHLGVGITTFCAIRSQEGRDEFFSQAQTQADEFALLYDIDNFDATTYNLLWKAGLGLNLRPFTAGLTVTTPNVRVAGSGSATLNRTSVGIDIDGDDIPDKSFATDIQTDVRANHKSPLSIGAGAAWHFPRSKIHVAAEWFDGTEIYDVLELQPFVSQATGETVPRELRHKTDSVVNVAVGFEHTFSPSYSGFLGFNTDRSAYNPASDVATTTYDLVHVAGGAKLRLKKVRFTLGARYAWGDQTTERQLDLIPDVGDDAFESLEEVTVEFRQLTLIVGFALDI
jgi:hypothetical protein